MMPTKDGAGYSCKASFSGRDRYMKRGPPTEAALLLLLGVKRGLLSLHFLYQFFDPINRKLVGNRSGYALVVLDLVVEFDTLVTHGLSRLRKGEQPKESRFVRS